MRTDVERSPLGTLLITGGAGFIGGNFVRRALADHDGPVVVIDKLTYAGHLATLAECQSDPRFRFVRADIADRTAMRALFEQHVPRAVVHLAAESHVDRSIDDPAAVIETNLVGTFELLEAARKRLALCGAAERERFRFVHVSTDEVYGSLGSTGLFTEETAYAPNSPYSASKAGSDHLARAYHHTYGLPVIITNCSNNYGPYQFPEKLIPLMTLNALEGRDLPIYGTGRNVRDWLHVTDHCEGLWQVLTRGVPGEKYNFGGDAERTNMQVVEALCAAVERVVPAQSNESLRRRGLTSYGELMTFVADRPGHDLRYAIDATKARRELGWAPQHSFERGLEETVCWYATHREWCTAVTAGQYDRERLGLAKQEGAR